MCEKIKTNKAKCLLCGDVIESKHRHDAVTCSCGKFSVDGGNYYLRRRFSREEDYEELSSYDTFKQKSDN